MPSSDYKSAAGGALKLKGSSITKNKKKKKPKAPPAEPKVSSHTPESSKPVEDSEEPSLETPLNPSTADIEAKELESLEQASTLQALRVSDEAMRESLQNETLDRGMPKTESQRKFEEQRRKKLHEKLKREGVKTHKERVEGLNRHLSSLSEHHDMPRIGPG